MKPTPANVDRFFARIDAHPADAMAIDGGDVKGRITWLELRQHVRHLQERLTRAGTQVLATCLPNGPESVLLDLAALRAGVVHVPIPTFFTDAQVQHVLAVSGADTVVDAQGGWSRRRTQRPPMPADTAKLTFTSGTTGTPKGVCLSADALLSVADGVAEATRSLNVERHLNALPFAVLLENIVGILAPMAVGVQVIARPLEQVGLVGAVRFDPARLDETIRATEAHSVVLLPQMLRAWAGWLMMTRQAAPSSLRLVAVGGAPVGMANLALARQVGLPAFEGYGLSEGASVQTLNLPGADRPGCVGRPLPHARIRINDAGEVEIGGPLMSGVLEADGRFTPRAAASDGSTDWFPTGDLGQIEADGQLQVIGRRKHVLITGFGRNVSPEWIETLLEDAPSPIARAVVLGDDEAELGAVIWPIRPDIPQVQIADTIDRINRQLPDYARIGPWCVASQPFDASSGFATANGRPRRDAIATAYRQPLFGKTTFLAQSAA